MAGLVLFRLAITWNRYLLFEGWRSLLAFRARLRSVDFELPGTAVRHILLYDEVGPCLALATEFGLDFWEGALSKLNVLWPLSHIHSVRTDLDNLITGFGCIILFGEIDRKLVFIAVDLWLSFE